jgi:dihydrofolate synthase/folylpolyglutamate synthase
MTYQETLAYIYGLGRFGMKPGLAKITSLLQALDNPHHRVQTVQVAGTNGKGSTAAFLATILAAGGYRVGLFTSPHLVSFTERFRVNGVQISEEEVVALAERVLAASPPKATFFETVTAMAFLWFAEAGVDMAIMEVGMGGRLDATNVSNGLLSVITPVALDHCTHLGTTVEEIAGEKAGIIKPGQTVVVARQTAQAREVIEAKAVRMGASVVRYGDDFVAEWREDGLSYRGLNVTLGGLKPGIGGRYQETNVGVALAAAEILGTMGYPLSDATLRQGVEQALWPGRMEMVSTVPRIMLDCAHNPAGAEALAESLAVTPRDRLLLVVGMMGDKDPEGILAPLIPLADEVFAVTPSLERALSSAELAVFCRSLGGRCADAGTVGAGLTAARSSAGIADLILVCGSIFTVGEAKSILSGVDFEPFRG